MAKKRKKDKEKEEEYEFRPPDFSEREFLKKELRDTKGALYTILYAILFGAIAGVISMFSNGLEIISFMVVFIGMVTLRYFYDIVKVDTSEYAKKNWAGNIGTFFFTFLAIWVLMMNPPFADDSSPTIEKVRVYVTHGLDIDYIEYQYVKSEGTYLWLSSTGERITATNTPVHGAADYTINVTARITDNTGVSSAMISISFSPGTYHNMTYEGAHIYGSDFTGGILTTSELRFHFLATDHHGHEARQSPAAIPVIL